LNTLSPIFVTVFGILIDVNTLSNCNAVEIKLRVGTESVIDNVVHDGKLLLNDDTDNTFNVAKSIVTDVIWFDGIVKLLTVDGIVIDGNNVLAVLVIVKLEQDVKILLNVYVVAFIVARSILTAVILLPISVPILVTPGGIDIFFNAVHPENALAPIVFTLNGIVIVVNLVPPSNAFAPILLTVVGILHDNKLPTIVDVFPFFFKKVFVVISDTLGSSV
jgi:hypothetical protein